LIEEFQPGVAPARGLVDQPDQIREFTCIVHVKIRPSE
jgi:hypothetical protein